MKLREYTLETLAEMVVGNNQAFPYRSSRFITSFVTRCELPFAHDGSTRHRWAKDVLMQPNLGPGRSPDLPADPIVRMISELFDADELDRDGKSRDAALEEMNKLLARDALAAYFDEAGRCFVRNTGTGTNSSLSPQTPRPLTAAEIGANAAARLQQEPDHREHALKQVVDVARLLDRHLVGFGVADHDCCRSPLARSLRSRAARGNPARERPCPAAP